MWQKGKKNEIMKLKIFSLAEFSVSVGRCVYGFSAVVPECLVPLARLGGYGWGNGEKLRECGKVGKSVIPKKVA